MGRGVREPWEPGELPEGDEWPRGEPRRLPGEPRRLPGEPRMLLGEDL